jgi:hypothetical protein
MNLLSEFNVHHCVKQKDALLQTINRSKTAFQGPKYWKFHELENEILEYILGLCNNGVAVSYKCCILKQYNSSSQFQVRRGWMYHFMQSKGLSLRRWTSLNQQMPEDDDKTIAFQKFVIILRKYNSYLLSLIGNMDQTPLYFDMLTNKVIEGNGKRA